MTSEIIRDQSMGQCYQMMQSYTDAEYAGVELKDYVGVQDALPKDDPVTKAVEEFIVGQRDSPFLFESDGTGDAP